MLDFDTVIGKLIDVPKGVNFHAYPGCRDREIAIEAKILDRSGFSFRLCMVTTYFVIPSKSGQGMLNALIKKHIKPDAEKLLDVAMQDFNARGFVVHPYLECSS